MVVGQLREEEAEEERGCYNFLWPMWFQVKTFANLLKGNGEEQQEEASQETKEKRKSKRKRRKEPEKSKGRKVMNGE
jgi:hypothetical protein